MPEVLLTSSCHAELLSLIRKSTFGWKMKGKTMLPEELRASTDWMYVRLNVVVASSCNGWTSIENDLSGLGLSNGLGAVVSPLSEQFGYYKVTKS